MKKAVLIVGAACVLGAGAFWVLDGESSRVSDDPTRLPAERTDPGGDPDTPKGAGPIGRSESVRSVERRTETAALPQGLVGRVLAKTGGAVGDATVELLRPLLGQELLQQMIQGGGLPQPERFGRTTTAPDGTFRLPARPGMGLQLRVRAEGFVPFSQAVERLSAGEWRRVPPIHLDGGRTLTGIVRDAETRAPIAGADVGVRVSTPTFGFTMPSEDLITAASDASGRYTLRGMPDGPLELTAVARGYARTTRTGLVFDAGQRSRSEDIELSAGFEITGTVTDSSGAVIAGARVEAQGYSATTPSSGIARTDEAGNFEILGLADDSFVVSVTANGFSRNERKPIRAPSSDVVIVLERQATIRVHVVDTTGRSLRGFWLSLRAHIEPDGIGRTQIEPGQVRAKAGVHEITGVDPGHYLVEVHAAGFAKTFSEPFEVQAGGSEPAGVRVVMTKGGTVTGTVTDVAGAPVARAVVATRAADYPGPLPVLGDLFASAPMRTTRKQARTDAEGRFRIDALSAGKYQLRIAHPNFAPLVAADVTVPATGSTDAGPLRMKQGGLLQGVFYVNGVLAPAIEVTASRTDPGRTFFAQAVTDDKGAFRFAKRLPAGNYEVTGKPLGIQDITVILFLQQSRKQVEVREAATERVTLQVNVKK